MKKKISDKKRYSSGKVLLVDEVDTFFSKDFYGNTYNPCAIIKNNLIIELIECIWKN